MNFTMRRSIALALIPLMLATAAAPAFADERLMMFRPPPEAAPPAPPAAGDMTLLGVKTDQDGKAGGAAGDPGFLVYVTRAPDGKGKADGALMVVTTASEEGESAARLDEFMKWLAGRASGRQAAVVFAENEEDLTDFVLRTELARELEKAKSDSRVQEYLREVEYTAGVAVGAGKTAAGVGVGVAKGVAHLKIQAVPHLHAAVWLMGLCPRDCLVPVPGCEIFVKAARALINVGSATLGAAVAVKRFVCSPIGTLRSAYRGFQRAKLKRQLAWIKSPYELGKADADTGGRLVIGAISLVQDVELAGTAVSAGAGYASGQYRSLGEVGTRMARPGKVTAVISAAVGLVVKYFRVQWSRGEQAADPSNPTNLPVALGQTDLVPTVDASGSAVLYIASGPPIALPPAPPVMPERSAADVAADLAGAEATAAALEGERATAERALREAEALRDAAEADRDALKASMPGSKTPAQIQALAEAGKRATGAKNLVKTRTEEFSQAVNKANAAHELVESLKNGSGPSFKVPDGGWLQSSEAPDRGHALAKHVVQTRKQCEDWMDADAKDMNSTFWNQDMAESVVAQTIRAHRAEIERWLGLGTEEKLKLNYPGDGATVLGQSLTRGASTMVDCTQALVVLKRSGHGFFVLTAFPE